MKLLIVFSIFLIGGHVADDDLAAGNNEHVKLMVTVEVDGSYTIKKTIEPNLVPPIIEMLSSAEVLSKLSLESKLEKSIVDSLKEGWMKLSTLSIMSNEGQKVVGEMALTLNELVGLEHKMHLEKISDSRRFYSLGAEQYMAEIGISRSSVDLQSEKIKRRSAALEKKLRSIFVVVVNKLVEDFQEEDRRMIAEVFNLKVEVFPALCVLRESLQIFRDRQFSKVEDICNKQLYELGPSGELVSAGTIESDPFLDFIEVFANCDFPKDLPVYRSEREIATAWMALRKEFSSARKQIRRSRGASANMRSSDLEEVRTLRLEYERKCTELVSHFEDSLDESQVRRLVEVRFLSKLVSHGPHIALFCREGEVFFDKKFDSDEWNLARKRAKESQNYLEKELRQLERQLLTDFDPVEVGGVDITDAFRFTSNELYRMPPIELLCPARSVE